MSVTKNIWYRIKYGWKGKKYLIFQMTIVIIVGSLTVYFFFNPLFLKNFSTLLLSKNKENKIEKMITDFNETLDKKNKTGIVDRQDIEVLKNSLQRKHDIENYPLEYLLEDYLRHLIDPPRKATNKDSTSKEMEKENKIYDKIKEMLLEEQKEKPFASTPEEERRILIALKSAIDSNDRNNSNFFINELASVISTRHFDFLRLESANRWSIPLAIAGVFSTIILGIMGIAISIKYGKLGREFKRHIAELLPKE